MVWAEGEGKTWEHVMRKGEKNEEWEKESGTSISKHKRTAHEDRERVCGCVPTRHLNYPRLVLKLPPLLLWAATVIGLYRAICWLPR